MSTSPRLVIEKKVYDQERDLYGIKHADLFYCKTEGCGDGESALKETRDIRCVHCEFRLRYPFWHAQDVFITDSIFTDGSNAPAWYTKNFVIVNSTINGIKFIRECDNTTIENCKILSGEFCWMSRGIRVANSTLTSGYAFLQTRDVEIQNLTMTAKYSMQYMENAVIRDSNIISKDLLWHARNVTVYDSVLDGDYLAWYAENIKLVRCKISGFQPFVYCKNVTLEDCTMPTCDLAFERTSGDSSIIGHVISIKNPLGTITVDSVDEIVFDDSLPVEERGKVIIRSHSST